MKFNNHRFIVSGIVACLTSAALSSSVYAQSGNPHVHGSATMNVVVDKLQLFAEFQAPMASIVGFEYQPETRIEKLKLKDAVKELKHAKLFLFDGASCELLRVESELPWGGAEKASVLHNAGHDHEKHHNEGHEVHHGEGHKDHHDEGHADHHDEGHADHKDHHEKEHHPEESDTHSDIRLTYRFNCDGNVKGMSLNHFQLFSLVESIQVQWITGAGQGAMSLSKAKNSLSF